MVTIRDLYIVELSDLLDAEQQMLRELPLMSSRATSPGLRELFDEHYRETLRHVERLRMVFDRLDERPRTIVCHAIGGLIDDARERHGGWERGTTLDSALAGIAHHLEHFEIAGYEAAASFATALGDAEATTLLRETLGEEERAARRLAEVLRPVDGDTAKPEATPTSLMAGVWVTETSGFAAVPPRADSDVEQDAVRNA
jgi:ferritin-like metal-binding protein YciE